MKTSILFLYIFMVVIAASCNFTGRANQALAPEDVPQYGPGNYTTDTSIVVPPTVTSAEEIDLQAINYSFLNRQISATDYTWLVMYATWCSHCQQNIGKYATLAENITERNLQIILLAQDDDKVATRNMLFKNGILDKNAYILDKQAYGADEKQRVERFRAEFCEECEGLPVGTPHHFLFDKNGKLIFQLIGSDIDKNYLLSFMP